MKKFLFILALVFTTGFVNASKLVIGNPNFERNLPIFKDVILKEFPNHAAKADYFAAQVEKESCANKTKCWNEKAQLFTYEDLMSGKRREYGFGLGQITITKKFNNFEEIKKRHPKLKDWKFSERFDARRQMISLFVLNNVCFNQVKWAGREEDRYAMMFACYNGGYGHIVKDRQLCINRKGCNKDLWFNNIELDSVKSKTRHQGYGKSFFEINREYPREIMFKRNEKYKPYLKDLSTKKVIKEEKPMVVEKPKVIEEKKPEEVKTIKALTPDEFEKLQKEKHQKDTSEENKKEVENINESLLSRLVSSIKSLFK